MREECIGSITSAPCKQVNNLSPPDHVTDELISDMIMSQEALVGTPVLTVFLLFSILIILCILLCISQFFLLYLKKKRKLKMKIGFSFEILAGLKCAISPFFPRFKPWQLKLRRLATLMLYYSSLYCRLESE